MTDEEYNVQIEGLTRVFKHEPQEYLLQRLLYAGILLIALLLRDLTKAVVGQADRHS